jgi:hypothetical protein
MPKNDSTPTPAPAPVQTLRVQVGDLVDYATERAFKTGSRGYWYGGKTTLPNGKRYQISLSVVEIGSKPA